MKACEKCGSFKYTDICPEYETLEQYIIFIESRKEDIKNIKLAIRKARNEIIKKRLCKLLNLK